MALAIVSLAFVVAPESPSAATTNRLATFPLFTPDVVLTSISCLAPGTCTAVGNYSTRTEQFPIVADEVNGVWRNATVLSGTSGNPDNQLNSVSCWNHNSCTAVGSTSIDYQGFPIDSQPITATEINGVWSSYDTLSEQLSPGYGSVSCTLSSECTAVGGFSYPTANDVSTYITQLNGAWQTPGFLGYYGIATGVSCVATNECTAVGGDIVTSTSGVWSTPESSSAGPIGVSCTDATTCTAVGVDASGAPDVVRESDGVWGASMTISTPLGHGILNDVSCASPVDCVAVGYDYVNLPGAPFEQEPFYVVERNGTWERATQVPLPVLGGAMTGVSCPSITTCTVIGSDPAGHSVYATLIDGRWPSKPSAPAIFRATAHDHSITVSWFAPATHGGNPLTGYTVSAVHGTRTRTCESRGRQRCTVTGLANGVPYTVTVVAWNAAGSSPASSSRMVTPVA